MSSVQNHETPLRNKQTLREVGTSVPSYKNGSDTIADGPTDGRTDRRSEKRTRLFLYTPKLCLWGDLYNKVSFFLEQITY